MLNSNVSLKFTFFFFLKSDCDSVTIIFPVCSQHFLWWCLHEPAALGFCVDSEASQSVSLTGLRISEKTQTAESKRNFSATANMSSSTNVTYGSDQPKRTQISYA